MRLFCIWITSTGEGNMVHTLSLSRGWRENEVLWLHVPVPLGWHYYPVGHPEFHNEVDLTELDQYFGVAQGQVLIPRDLYHHVALYRWGTNSPFHCKSAMLTINLTIPWWEIVAGTYEPCKGHIVQNWNPEGCGLGIQDYSYQWTLALAPFASASL